MGQIRVTPAELRRIADSIDRSARVVEDRVSATGQIIGPLIQNGVFRGNLASSLMTGYEQTRPTMEKWPHDMRNFSAMLRLAADKFEEADQQHAARIGGALALEGTGSAPGGSRDADLLLSGACTDRVDLGPGVNFVPAGGAYGQGQVVITDPAMIQQIANQYGLNIGPVRELRIDVYVPNGGMWPLSNMVGYDGPSIGAILPQPGNLYGDYTVQPYTFQPTGPQSPGTQPLTFYTWTPVAWTGGQWADSSITFNPVLQGFSSQGYFVQDRNMLGYVTNQIGRSLGSAGNYFYVPAQITPGPNPGQYQFGYWNRLGEMRSYQGAINYAAGVWSDTVANEAITPSGGGTTHLDTAMGALDIVNLGLAYASVQVNRDRLNHVFDGYTTYPGVVNVQLQEFQVTNSGGTVPQNTLRAVITIDQGITVAPIGPNANTPDPNVVYNYNVTSYISGQGIYGANVQQAGGMSVSR